MRKLLLWLVMVAAMVAAILGGTAAFLYSRTGEDRLPQQPVQFGRRNWMTAAAQQGGECGVRRVGIGHGQLGARRRND